MKTATVGYAQLTTWHATRTPVRFGRHRNPWLITDVQACTASGCDCAGVVTLVEQGQDVSHRIVGYHVHGDVEAL